MTPAPAGTESVLKREIEKALRQLTYLKVVRINAGVVLLNKGTPQQRAMHNAEAGTPDLLIVLPIGRVAWIEVKTETGKVNPAQLAYHVALRRLGHSVFVVRSVVHALRVVNDLVLRAQRSSAA